jgi:hypothetical protein
MEELDELKTDSGYSQYLAPDQRPHQKSDSIEKTAFASVVGVLPSSGHSTEYGKTDW